MLVPNDDIPLVFLDDDADAFGGTVRGHLATRESDNQDALTRFGERAVQRYARLSLLAPNFTGAHAGAIDAADVVA